MDSYMVYKRCVDALNQGTQTQVFVMPIGACIEQSTLVRICRFELFKQESQVSEDDWKRYFLDARNPDYFAYQQLDVAMGTLAVVITLQDAESRMSRLLADFYSAVNGVNMESIIHEDPKRVVGYLVDALRPAVFRSAVKDSLARPAGKQLKKDVSQFLRWLRPQMEEFMKYETHILAKTQVVHGVGSVPLTIAEETNLVLRFETPGGPLVLRNVVCGICPAPLPAGVGDILLSDAVMERLGYDPYKLIESAQLVQSEYELGDIGAPDHEAGVCAYGVSAGGVTPEEASLSAAEDAV
ncbi:hypothetical protein PR002_g25618 [Phytophthora rubi]|uniref:Uncharacterized protein n=1 Tax=Phytophthora rubi TaxID=129364 RepID=A0A6A3I590_9STRA|nr:hypothetical protein PR002_g25618 [Phytophthora rubi]